ncbi:Long-chain-fatty-acid--CoA ligase 4 [Tyrophagus putrescentiae]|nr:Long-chain-fatty-acid--CoA ligase 4 [Tyrophagus putrescentiae]
MTATMKTVLVPLVVWLVRIVVTVYTIITLPLYYLIQMPWRRLKRAKSCGAHLVNKGRLSDSAPIDKVGVNFLEYERFAEIPYHPLMDCLTLSEAFVVVGKLYPHDQPSHGYRQIIDEEVQYDAATGQPICVDGKVLRKYRLSDYKWLTLGEVQDQVISFGRGLAAIGMQVDDRVTIFCETGIHFFSALLGANLYGGVVVTLFHTLNDDGLVHGVNETNAKFIVTSFELLDRIASFVQHCPKVEHVIYYEGPKKQKNINLPEHIKVWTFSQLLCLGHSEPYRDMKACPLPPKAIQLIMYTSGTTGVPKGVVATGAQIKESAMACGQVVRDIIPEGPKHIYIAYLPQAHILELSIEMFLFIGGVKIGYATPFTLNESAPGLLEGQVCDLQLLKPTVMTAVPLVLDRMQKEIYLKLSQRTPFSTDIFNYLIDYKSYWIQKGYQTPIVNQLLCGKIREQFGNRLQFLVVGGAPLAPKLQTLIRNSLEITLIQGYGTTETTGGCCCMDFNDLTYGRVGAPLNGVRVRLADWHEGGYSILDKPNPRGELLVGGKMISQGYYQLEEQTRENFFDEDGFHFFVTGDIGEMFPDGTIKIIDRKKDLHKLLNGEFISLGKIEAALKSSMYVDNICIVPNALLNSLVALVMPNQRALLQLARHLGTTTTSLAEICANPELVERVHSSILATGFEQHLKPIELPSLVTLCHEEWTPMNDMLTAAMKLKRANIAGKHAADLERMFAVLQQDPSRARVSRKSLVNV